ncbi:MAG TPA: MerR family transcriptional regulator, partial [Rhizobiales bacterium]|nr:MerR family transcriptional regulator [Hyphomicrobiales bacterium]
VMPAPDRSAGGSRLYVLQQVKRLHFIKRSRELGFSLDDVRRLLLLADGGQSCGEVKALTDRHLANIREKIEDLQRLERMLGDVSAKCSGDDAPECPVIDALFEGA